MTPCRIFLVDDHALFRSGLRGLLDRRKEYCVVGEAGDGQEFLSQLLATDIDVVFMDISMPVMGGIEATQRALEIRPELKIITLSMFGDENYYAGMVEAGAKGFLLKDSDIDEVTAAIEAVMNGENYFSPTVQRSISNSIYSTGTEDDSECDFLSPREIEILVGICQGLSNQEIADELFISKRTVDKHRANILEKTGCKNTASLVVYALRHELVNI